MTRIGLAGLLVIGFASGVSAADLPVKAPPVVSTAFNWSGFYAGANVGYGWGRTGGDLIGNSDGLNIPRAIAGGTIPSTYGLREHGPIGGGQVGYNWQSGVWVFGLEADLQRSGLRDTMSLSHPGTPGFLLATQSAGSAGLNWFGTARGRVGHAWQELLLYATGGLAYGHVSEFVFNHVLVPPPSGAFSATEFRWGWTLGAGAEWALTNAWSVKAEYLHVDLGNSSGLTHPGPADFLAYEFHHRYEIARIGIDYHFGAEPIVARY